MSAKRPALTIVDGDDWSALYADGVLQEQGHLDLESIELALKVARTPYTSFQADGDWLMERGQFPELLTDVVIDSLADDTDAVTNV